MSRSGESSNKSSGANIRVGMSRGPIVSPGVTGPRPVHDPLEAIVVYIGPGDAAPSTAAPAAGPVAIVALDLAVMSFAANRTMRQEMSALCGIPADSIVTHMTHTHSAAFGTELDGLAGRLAALVNQARSSAQPATMAWAQVDTAGRYNLCRRKTLPCGLGNISAFMGYDDHHGKADAGRQIRTRLAKWMGRPITEPELQGPIVYDEPVDSLFQGLFFRNDKGRPIGSLVRFACHPVLAGHTSLRMQSADFPTVVRRCIREAFGGECAYLNGPCGNIAPQERGDWLIEDPVAADDPAVFDPGVAWWIVHKDPQASWSTMERFGKALSQELIERIPPGDAFRPCRRLSFQLDLVDLPIRQDVPFDAQEARALKIAETQKLFAMRKTATLGEMKKQMDRVMALQGASRVGRFSAEDIARKLVQVQLPAIRLDDCVLMGFPGEVFWQTPQQARAQVEGRSLKYMSFTLANGTIAYIPTEADRLLGDYETDTSIVAPGAEAKLAQAARMLAETL